ncbi:MAG TPA: DUF2914 domain-containing protein, partial [Elusimicrobiota bacterium]|nr:DUF2914 domain-containing protein [Elusimicrobiota bacterium]
LFFQYREKRGEWTPPPALARLWAYNVEILHFVYGGLLSVYVVLYFQSGAGRRTAVFLFLVGALFVMNEFPLLRRNSHRLRLALYAFCVCSYLIYLVPILVGRLGGWVFGASVAISVGLLWSMAGLLTRREPARRKAQRRLFAPAAGVFGLIVLLYFLHLIPPVPLSVQWAGIFHDLEKTSEGYLLKTPRPPWHAFWKRESRPFRARPGDKIFYFVRIFAPARFEHAVHLRWYVYDAAAKRYVSSDRMLVTVIGGRRKGFRGYAYKTNYHPGRWRVVTETSDGRAIGITDFEVLADKGTGPREWKAVRS